jgi:glycerol-3-phosphate cytidylyltransferase/D-beta-D-heptose 7-phosphate kinase/D-beta-D-heptose 1-phosphate adenosyltransferase
MSTAGNVSVISGYFNPLHIGHLRLIQGAKQVAPHLVVIVNNDKQQLLKKGEIIMPESERLEIVAELRSVDHALLAIDDDPTVTGSIRAVRTAYPDSAITFCNGGGDRSDPADVPSAEAAVCAELKIDMRYGVGGVEKLDSSSRINAARGAQ